MNENNARWTRGNLILLLGMIFVLALIPRVLYVIQIETPPFSDERDYLDCAQNLLAGKGLVMANGFRAYRAPGYPLFLAGMELMPGDSVFLTRIVQSVLGALACALIAILGLRLFNNARWGLAAGFFAAFFDELIFYCGQLLTETLFTFLLILWLLGIHRFLEQRGKRQALFLGILLGILTLIRPAGLFLLAVPIILLFSRAKAASRRELIHFLALIAAGLIVAVLPWTVRNAAVLGKFVPLTTNNGVNLYIGHHEGFSYWSKGDKEGIRQDAKLGEVEESRLFARIAKEYAFSHPGKTLVNAITKVYNVYLAPWPFSYAISPVDRMSGPYKPWPWFGQGRELRYAGSVIIPAVPWSAPLLILAILGLVFGIRLRETWLPLLLVLVFHTLPCVIYFGDARFRLPVIPVILLFILLACREVVRGVRNREAQRS